MSETEVNIEEVKTQLEEPVVELVKEKVVELVKEKVEELVKEKVEELVKEKVELVQEKVELVQEKVEELILDFTNKTIPEMFLIILKQEENNVYCKKIGITISKDIIQIINKIIEVNPQLLNDIEKSIKEVLKDGKIDSNDIPEFILIIQILYERLNNNKSFKITSKNIIETCSTIVKFVIRTLVEERKIEIDFEKKSLFIEQLDKLIDSCMCLLNFNNVLIPNTCNCTIM